MPDIQYENAVSIGGAHSFVIKYVNYHVYLHHLWWLDSEVFLSFRPETRNQLFILFKI